MASSSPVSCVAPTAAEPKTAVTTESPHSLPACFPSKLPDYADPCPVSLPSVIPTQNPAPTSEIQLQSPPQQPGPYS